MDSEAVPTEPGSPASGDASAPLIGTLEDYSPAGVLQVLSSQGETGAVRFNGEGGCTVYLHDGQLYFAETTDTGEALAIALVRPGRLTPDDWDNATAAGYPTQQVGQELIDRGAIDRELLASVVLSVVYDPLIHLFRQAQGDFEFEPGTVHWMGPFRTFDVDAIVAEVRRRVREADEMAPLIPTLDVWVESARTLPADRGNVNLRRDDWEVVVAAAGGRTLPDLAVELGRGVWSTARLVYRLATVDLLEISPGTVAEPAEAEFAPAQEPATFAPAAATSGFLDAPDTDQVEAPAAFDEPAPADAGSGFLDAPASSGFLDAPTDTDTDTDTDTGEPAFGEDSGFTPVVDISTPISAGEGPPAITGWDTPDTEQSDDSGTSWGETAWDDQPWDAPSSTPEGGQVEETTWETGDAWEAPAADRSQAEPEAPFVDEPAAAPTGDHGIDLGPANQHGITFEAPTLHPDIAKALAESTYADSATAINAMAARLGAAADDDDDDEWEAAPVAAAETGRGGDDFEQFWSGDTEERTFPWEGDEKPAGDEWAATPAEEADDGLTWQPTSWDTGVENDPLPQRDRVRAEGDEGQGPAGAADPEWLENLYSQFMADGEAPTGKRRGREANPVETAFAASPDELPKTKPLRRVIAAIRRL